MRLRTFGVAVLLTVAAASNLSGANAGHGLVTYERGGDLAARAAVAKAAPPVLPADQHVLGVKRSLADLGGGRYLVMDVVGTVAGTTARTFVVDLAAGTTTPHGSASKSRRGHGRDVCVTGQTVENPEYTACKKDEEMMWETAKVMCATGDHVVCTTWTNMAAETTVRCNDTPETYYTGDVCQWVQVPHSGNPRVDNGVNNTAEEVDNNYCKQRPCEI